MPHLRLTRFRIRKAWMQRDPRWRRGMEWAGRGLAAVVLLVAVVFLAMYPRWWTAYRDRRAVMVWGEPRVRVLNGLQQRWGKYPALPDFTTGEEPAMRGYLKAWPEVEALRRRGEGSQVWVRREGRMVAADPVRDAAVLAMFSLAGNLDPGDTVCPALGPAEAPERMPRLVFAGENWLVLKVWRIGSPEMEQVLRALLPSPSPVRLGLLPEDVRPSLLVPPQPWGAWPNLQIDTHRLAETSWIDVRTNMFEEIWNVYLVPPPEVMAAFATQHRWNLVWGTLQSLSVAGLAGLLWAWRRRLGRERQREADRLAALTHSLKTPLAALKLRCDLIRLEPEAPLALRGALLELSEEVDSLALTLGKGLRLFKASHVGGTHGFCEALGPAWFEEVARDLEPAFLAQGRELHLDLTDAPAWAAPETLQMALQTVLENALQHGAGEVRLTTAREGQRFVICIGDEGPGLDAEALKALVQVSPPSGTPSAAGLGLALLARVAAEEGWGLELASREGAGLTVLLQVPAASPSRQGVPAHA